jgi:NADH:ubiquinone oxidoreductase subunit E
MRQLSKEAEANLLAAIEKAAAQVNAGEMPNEAIVKIAKEQDMPAGHVRLMVHAYNTGRTTKQREAGESTSEKAADFNLADVDAILDTLYPAAVKTAAEITRGEVVSTEYAVSPNSFLARRVSGMQKAAAAMPEKTWIPPPRDDHSAVMRSYSEKQAAKRVEEELRRESTMAYGKAANAMEQLHEYFRRPGNMAFQDAMRETELRYGVDAVNVLKKVAAVYPHLEKQAGTSKSHFGTCAACDLAQNVLTAVESYNAAKGRLAPPKTAAVKAPAPEVVTGSILYNPLEESLDLKKANALSPIPMGPVGMTQYLGQQMSTGMNSYIKEPDKMLNDTLKDITDPDHERKLRNIRAQSVVTDLMTNDPVISGHDPREVANAFNELAEVAPSFMDSTATVQALLRKRLESGQLADFDIKQLLDMEKVKAEKQKSIVDARSKEMGMI